MTVWLGEGRVATLPGGSVTHPFYRVSPALPTPRPGVLAPALVPFLAPHPIRSLHRGVRLGI
jgi:hypothetical protein